MAKIARDQTTKLLEELLGSTQDLFILQALTLGVKGDAIRNLLHVDQWRVTNISKLLKTRKTTE